MTQSPNDQTHPQAETPEADAWRRCRTDYERGVSAPVAAERHGLAARSVRRRAAAEDWRKPAPPASLWAEVHGARPALAGSPPTQEEEFAEHPGLEAFVDAHTFEVGELLLNPQPTALSRFAFRRAAEAAVRGAAAEAGAWMRLAAQVGRAADKLERAGRNFSPADYMRATYAAQLREVWESRSGDEEDEAAEERLAPDP